MQYPDSEATSANATPYFSRYICRYNILTVRLDLQMQYRHVLPIGHSKLWETFAHTLTSERHKQVDLGQLVIPLIMLELAGYSEVSLGLLLLLRDQASWEQCMVNLKVLCTNNRMCLANACGSHKHVSVKTNACVCQMYRRVRCMCLTNLLQLGLLLLCQRVSDASTIF